MKYIWIIMLAIVDIIWIITSMVEFIRATNVMLKWKGYSVFDWKGYSVFDWINDFLLEVKDYATGCLLMHMFTLFLISLVTFFIAE